MEFATKCKSLLQQVKGQTGLVKNSEIVFIFEIENTSNSGVEFSDPRLKFEMNNSSCCKYV